MHWYRVNEYEHLFEHLHSVTACLVTADTRQEISFLEKITWK